MGEFFLKKNCLRPSGEFLFPLEVFVFLPQGNAKPAERQGRGITGLIGDNRIALKKLVRLSFSKSKIKLIKTIIIPKNNDKDQFRHFVA